VPNEDPMKAQWRRRRWCLYRLSRPVRERGGACHWPSRRQGRGWEKEKGDVIFEGVAVVAAAVADSAPRSSSASSGTLAPRTVLLPQLYHSLYFTTRAGSSRVMPASTSTRIFLQVLVHFTTLSLCSPCIVPRFLRGWI
jgi:hypothetical protein